MSDIARGIKAGLASGLIYGALVGFLHAGLLEACSQTQIAFITQNLIASPSTTRMIAYYSSQTASDIFGTDLLHFPIYWAIGGLIAGVVYGAVFPIVYSRLPGENSRKKGMWLGVIVFILGIFFGLSGIEVICSPGIFPVLAMVASVLASLAYGYFLGMFYDSFGRLSVEERKEKEERRSSALKKTAIQGKKIRNL
jgi:hypothetical protein